MRETYGYLLENPRRKRRKKKGTKRKATRRRRARSRRSNPFFGKVRRRRRSSGRRRTAGRARRRGGRRRNPLKLGGVKPALMKGVEFLGADLAGDAMVRLANKFGAAKLTAKLPPVAQTGAMRVIVGLLGPSLLGFFPKMFKPGFRSTFAAFNVYVGLAAMTANMRQSTFAKVGLSGSDGYPLMDYQMGALGDWETDDDSMDLGISDYEMAGVPSSGVLGDSYAASRGIFGY